MALLLTCLLASPILQGGGLQKFTPMQSSERKIFAKDGRAVKTVPSSFLTHGGSVYLPSATFPIKQATVYERFYWSADGSQLAIVTDSHISQPGAQLQKLARGESLDTPQRLSIWNRDTGRLRDVVVPTDSTTGFDKVFFMGRSLAFTAFSKTTNIGLWIAPESGPIQQVPVGYISGGASFAASRTRAAILVGDGESLRLVNGGQTRKIPLPAGQSVSAWGVNDKDQGIIRMAGAGRVEFRFVDFDTGKLTIALEIPEELLPGTPRPFIVDTYSKSSQVAYSIDARAKSVDAASSPVMIEDGGFQLDLVESTGPVRRRIRLATDAAQYPVVSDNGLSFAFVSNGVLMARCLVRTDAATTKKLIGIR